MNMNMKLTKILFPTLLAVIAILFYVPMTNAATISFGDTQKYWPDWGNTSTSYGYIDNDLDVIGVPDFTGGTVEINNQGYLTKITIQQNQVFDSLYSLLSPGDLFINVDANFNTTWDYLVDLTSWTKPGKTDNPDPSAGNYNIYSISAPLGNSSSNPGYILSGKDNSSGTYLGGNSWDWSGYVIRNDHPVAWGGSETDTGWDANFSGWHDLYTESWTFDFPSGAILLGNQFTIAWEPNCANDVLYETMDRPPVPEPATMLLVGSGLIGLAGFGRRKFRKA